MPFELLNPKGLERPVGYAHVAKVTGGSIAYVAGQAPFDENGQVVGKGDFVVQFVQVIRNLKTAAESVGGRPDQYAALTIYITDLQAYLNYSSCWVALIVKYSVSTSLRLHWCR